MHLNSVSDAGRWGLPHEGGEGVGQVRSGLTHDAPASGALRYGSLVEVLKEGKKLITAHFIMHFHPFSPLLTILTHFKISIFSHHSPGFPCSWRPTR